MKSLDITLFWEDGKYCKSINENSFTPFDISENLKKDLQILDEYHKNKKGTILSSDNQKVDEDFLINVGKSLFNLIFDENFIYPNDNNTLRINFIINHDELISYPWELMHNGDNWLCNLKCNIVRYKSPTTNVRTITDKFQENS